MYEQEKWEDNPKGWKDFTNKMESFELRTELPKTGCTKPDCDCIEKAIAENGGNEVKSYPCLKADHSGLTELKQPAPAEDDKEYREFVAKEMGILGKKAVDWESRQTKKLAGFYWRLIADIKKGMEKTQEWISVKDRLPEDGQRCWVSYPIIDPFTEKEKTVVSNYLYQKPENRWGEENYITLIAPTHWQPYFVPAPPENEKI